MLKQRNNFTEECEVDNTRISLGSEPRGNSAPICTFGFLSQQLGSFPPYPTSRDASCEGFLPAHLCASNMQLRPLWTASALALPTITRAFEAFSAAGQNNLPTSPVLLQQPIRSVSNMTRGAVISLSHGGGPLPLLGDPGHKEIIRSLKTRVPEILKLNAEERPKAIVIVTAHWSEKNPTISNGKKHKLYYDYGGFPSETYKLKYEAPGSPEVAKEVGDALAKAGLKPKYDEDRGEH